MAVPRGVHRSLVNRYGPRTPAIPGGKLLGLDTGASGGAGAGGGAAGLRGRLGGGLGLTGGLPLVGSSRPLLELSSCTACAAIEEEMARLKSDEQNEVRYSNGGCCIVFVAKFVHIRSVCCCLRNRSSSCNELTGVL